MNRVVTLVVWLSALAGFAHAQEAVRVVGSPVLLVERGDAPFIQPRWSPDGTMLAFTSDSYRGLWVVDTGGEELRLLSDDRAAGFGFSWSPDGSSIVSRVARYDGLRRKDAVKLFDVVAGEQRLLTEFRDDLPVLPRWTRDGAHVVIHNRGRVEVLQAMMGKALSATPVVTVQGDRLAVAEPVAGVLRVLDGLPEGFPINVEPSPDGSKIAYEVVGGNLLVVSVEGALLADLGRGHRPEWSPDGQWIVFMRTEDDGHVITASDLYAARSDGALILQLTDTPTSLEMNPSWSPDGDRITYDDRGAIFDIRISR